MKVSFLGLGIMGSRMAANLAQNKVSLTVYNRSADKAETFRSAGAAVASSVQQAVAEADVVFSMLSTPVVVKELATGEQGFLQQMKQQAVWIDCTTVNPSFSREMAQHAAEANIRFLEAPVAGTKPHAENAELVFFVGGAEADLKEVASLLDVMGRKTVYVGGSGMGSSLKMLVNAMLAQSMVMFSESVVLGEKMGLDRSFLLNFLPNLVVAAPFTKAKAEMIKTADYEVQFPLEWMHKDLQLVAQTAYELQQPLFLANVTKELFAKAIQEGMGREDFAAIHKLIQ
ncbi:MAG: NAD(P)-dependent oxidoreductase [Bacteroidota bacterium]